MTESAGGTGAPPDGADPADAPADADAAARQAAYWSRNLLYMGLLLSVWALVSFGCGLVFADALNAYRLPGTGFKLGFWFAQQGSIYVFDVLSFLYSALMHRMEQRMAIVPDQV